MWVWGNNRLRLFLARNITPKSRFYVGGNKWRYLFWDL